MGRRVAIGIETAFWVGVFGLFAEGLAALVGWMVGREELILLHSGFTPVPLAAALSFVVLALALMLVAQGHPTVAASAAGLPSTLAATSLLCDLFDLPPALDRLLASVIGVPRTDLVQAMTWPLALGVLSLGAGLVLVATARSRRLIVAATIPALMLGVAAALLDTRAFGSSGVGFGTGLGLAAAAALVLGALALLSLAFVDERHASRWVFMPLAVGAVLSVVPILFVPGPAAAQGGVPASVEAVLSLSILTAAALGLAASAGAAPSGDETMEARSQGVPLASPPRPDADATSDDARAFRALAIEAQRIGVFDWSLETNAVTWSADVQQLLGYDGPAPTMPVSFHAIAHPEDRRRLERKMTSHLAGGEPLRLALRLQRATGDYGLFLFAAQAARDERGRPARLCGSLIALTDDLQADLAIGLARS